MKDARITQRLVAVALTLVVPAIAPRLFSDALSVRLEGDSLRFSAPNFSFLSGRPLERLKNGATVFYDFYVSLWTSPRVTPRRRNATRFAVSYDLWEEKFSVTHWQEPKQNVTMLSQKAAQEWCLDRLRLPVNGVE